MAANPLHGNSLYKNCDLCSQSWPCSWQGTPYSFISIGTCKPEADSRGRIPHNWVMIYSALGCLNPRNWWKECSWTLKRLKALWTDRKPANIEEKRATAGRQMKSSPILGHPHNSFLTRGRGFQSSPIGWVNCSIGNTALMYKSNQDS